MSLPISIEGPIPALYKQSATKGPFMLGTRCVCPDGRVYRYMRAGGANITIGRVIGAAAAITTHDSDVVVMEARTTAEWDAGDLTIRIKTTGSTSSTALNLVANQYADGYIWVNDEAGEGQLLQVKSHAGETATGSTGGLDIVCHDDAVLTIALSAVSQVGLRYNLYDQVRIHTGTTAGGPAIGVAPIVVTASRYFWGQTWGPCPVMTGVLRPLTGDKVCVINTTGGDTGLTGIAGSIYPLYLSATDASTASSTAMIDKYGEADNMPVVGYTLMRSSAKLEYSLIYLTISP